ncbi:hypothetical protein Tco_0115001 [Tanacetum coccineum]
MKDSRPDSGDVVWISYPAVWTHKSWYAAESWRQASGSAVQLGRPKETPSLATDVMKISDAVKAPEILTLLPLVDVRACLVPYREILADMIA